MDELYRDHFYSINKDFNDYSFLEDLYKLNNEYMGLGLGNMYMSSGMDYVSQNTLCSDYGRSLMSDLTGQNGTAATMAAMAASIPGPDQWTLASPADRLKLGRENGIYQSYTLVGAYRKKQQVGERDNTENGETDDFITGYEFHYETEDGKEFKSYIDARPDHEVYGSAQSSEKIPFGEKGSIPGLPDIAPNMFPGVGIEVSTMATITGRGYYDNKTKTLQLPIGAMTSYAQHEYGHYLQSIQMPASCYKAVENASFKNAMLQFLPWVEKHDTFWTEKDANRRSIQFFGSNSEIAKFGIWPQ